MRSRHKSRGPLSWDIVVNAIQGHHCIHERPSAHVLDNGTVDALESLDEWMPGIERGHGVLQNPGVSPDDRLPMDVVVVAAQKNSRVGDIGANHHTGCRHGLREKGGVRERAIDSPDVPGRVEIGGLAHWIGYSEGSGEFGL